MAAFGLSVALLIFWWILGYAVLAALDRRSNRLESMLLAPIAGAAATLLPIFWLNRVGWPVRSFAFPLAGCLAALAAGMLWKTRPPTPLRRWLLCGVALLAALLLTGAPMFEFGFNWASYVNPDLTSYSLAAHRFLERGYFDLPTAADIAGRDRTQHQWFLHALGGVRPGGDLLLAWLLALTGRHAPEVFMPLILALHAAMISAAGALACRSRTGRLTAALACMLVAFSALATLGVLYQLLGQVLGLGLAAGLASVLMRPPRALPLGHTIRRGLLAALLFSAAFVAYPEILPFLFLALVLYAAVLAISGRASLRSWLPVSATAGLAAILLLNTYAVPGFQFLMDQVRQGTTRLAAGELQYIRYPYYLTPGGAAAFWGLAPVHTTLGEPRMSLAIAGGFLLFAVAAWATFRALRDAQPAAAVCAVMLAALVYSFARRHDFGLYKLAMFAQPFVLATLAGAAVAVRRSRKWTAAAVLALALLEAGTLRLYVDRSRGSASSAGLSEARDASAMYGVFQRLAGAGQSAVISDTANPVLANLQSIYFRGRPILFPSTDYFALDAYNLAPGWRRLEQGSGGLPSRIVDGALALRRAHLARFAQVRLEGFPEGARFVQENYDADLGPDPAVLVSGPSQSVLNRRRPRGNFTLEPRSAIRGHLVFVASDRGLSYLSPRRDLVALHQIEPDPLYPGRTMAAVGPFLLFEVIGASGPVRFLLNVTSSLGGDVERRLPAAAVIGAARYPLPVVGRGSARVWSEPFMPQRIGGRSYVALEFDSAGQWFPEPRAGLMRLYGRDVRLDPRRPACFARDISLIEESEHAHMERPAQVTPSPAALADARVEYSGIYEDGWVAERVYLRLAQPRDCGTLRVTGAVPGISKTPFSTELVVSVDGAEVARRWLTPGNFEVAVPVAPRAEPRRVTLTFSRLQTLPPPDGRAASALLTFAGFVTAPASPHP